MRIASPGMQTQVFMVEDHDHLATALGLVFNGDRRFQTCGVAADIATAIATLPNSGADVVIVDFSLQSGSGFELISKLRGLGATPRFLIFSAQDPDVFATPSRKAGASGFFRKGASQEKLLEVVALVATGGEYFPSGEV